MTGINPHSWIARAVQAMRDRRVVNEVAAGSGNTFTLAHTPIDGTLDFKVNGLTLDEGTEPGAYSKSGRVIVTTTVYDTDAVVQASYDFD